jgi:CheY-like chemotaxis protein
VTCEPIPEPVYVDRDMWEKVVLNLLSNAFKFTFEGGVLVSLHAEGKHAVLSVRDTGVGIPEHELPRLFDRFHRIEGQRSRSYEGSGIGLALVRELVKLHGGAIETHSHVGEGTEFLVSIPLGRAHLDESRINAKRTGCSAATGVESFVEEALRWLPDEAANRPAAPREEKAAVETRELILLADDNADMRDYVRRLVESRYEVAAVGDGAAALEAIGRRRPALVLADIMMPVLDGFRPRRRHQERRVAS